MIRSSDSKTTDSGVTGVCPGFKMLKRLLLILALALAAPPALADAVSVRDHIINELKEDGYQEIRISRTLLGRLRFVASKTDTRREIILNPNSGVILRDYIQFLRGSDEDDDDRDDSGGSGENSAHSGGGSDDDDHDDGDHDDDDDDESDEDEEDDSSSDDDDKDDD